MTTRRHAITSVLVGVALLLTGCGQDDAELVGSGTEATTADDATTAAPATTPAPSPTTSDTSPPTPTAAPSTEATVASAAGGCDPAASDMAPEVPNGAERVQERIGDLDGDDAPDRLVTWAVTLDEDETVFHLRVVTGSGFVAERELTEASATADVRPLGTVPIGDGHQAALVVEDVGASAELISVWGSTTGRTSAARWGA